MPRLLVVGADPHTCRVIGNVFPLPGDAVVNAATVQQGIDLLAKFQPDAVLLSAEPTAKFGQEALGPFRAKDRQVPVILLTSQHDSHAAIWAVQCGAADVLPMPVECEQLRHVVHKVLQEIRRPRAPLVLEATSRPASSADGMLGRCLAMQEVFKTIARVAQHDVPVLVLGESGTGKELVARALHRHSRRKDRPMLQMNCAAIPEQLLESELFGHEKGAFTGADRQRAGKFEHAHGGTLFLDEVGDLPPTAQAKLLRVLEGHSFERLGGNTVLQCDVRILAATNKDLEQEVAAGGFRADLYQRLRAFQLRLPALRDRPGDLPLLVQYFVGQLNIRLGTEVTGIEPEAFRRLEEYPWPGNIRELQNVLSQAMIQSRGENLMLAAIVEALPSANGKAQPSATPPVTTLDQLADLIVQAGKIAGYRALMAAVEQAFLANALREAGGNEVQASKRLGISRTTLRSKMRSRNGAPKS